MPTAETRYTGSAAFSTQFSANPYSILGSELWKSLEVWRPKLCRSQCSVHDLHSEKKLMRADCKQVPPELHDECLRAACSLSSIPRNHPCSSSLMQVLPQVRILSIRLWWQHLPIEKWQQKCVYKKHTSMPTNTPSISLQKMKNWQQLWNWICL